MLKQKVRDLGKSSNTLPVDRITIDWIRPEDVDRIVEIERLSFRSPWSRSYFLQEIRQNPICFPWALRKRRRITSEILAFCICWILKDELHVNNLAVHPQYRKHGYGELLMNNALEFGIARGCKAATLEVRRSNRTALQLYAKLGFVTIGLIPEYYEDNNEDGYILRRNFIRI